MCFSRQCGCIAFISEAFKDLKVLPSPVVGVLTQVSCLSSQGTNTISASALLRSLWDYPAVLNFLGKPGLTLIPLQSEYSFNWRICGWMGFSSKLKSIPVVRCKKPLISANLFSFESFRCIMNSRIQVLKCVSIWGFFGCFYFIGWFVFSRVFFGWLVFCLSVCLLLESLQVKTCRLVKYVFCWVFIKSKGSALCFLCFPAVLCVFAYKAVFAVTVPHRLWVNHSVLRYE